MRFGLQCLPVSTLAGQWYCELKTHLDHSHPDVPKISEAAQLGRNAHDAIGLAASPASMEQIKQGISANKRIYLWEPVLSALMDKVQIIGVPDLVYLVGREARAILDLKFSTHQKLFKDWYVQVQTYGLLLQESGFGVSRLTCGVAAMPPLGQNASHAHESENDRRQEVKNFLQALNRLRPRIKRPRDCRDPLTTQVGTGILHLCTFNSIEAIQDIRWALDYWMERRGPIPTKMPAKCRGCHYNAAGICPDPKAQPNRSAVTM